MSRLLVMIVLSVMALAPAQAQYQWRDAKGRMVFSEFPPPHSVSQQRIIKGFKPLPRPTAKAPAEIDEAARTEGGPATETGPDLSANAVPGPAAAQSTQSRLAKRLADFNKRRDERIKKEKETREQQRVAARKKEMCRSIRADNRALSSGQRMARINKSGEREIIDDKMRQSRMQRNRNLIAKHCA